MTTRSAAEALEKLIRLERNLEKKCHDLGYYNMIHVGLREFVEHAETFRAALAPPQPLTDAQIVEIRDDHLPSQGEPFDCLAFARAVLRATQSATNTDAAKANGSAPPAPGPESGRSGPTFESPAQSAPCLIVTRGDGVPLPDQGVAIEQFKAQALKRAASAQKPINEEGPLEFGPQPAPGFHFDARGVLVANAAPPPPAPAQEPVAWMMPLGERGLIEWGHKRPDTGDHDKWRPLYSHSHECSDDFTGEIATPSKESLLEDLRLLSNLERAHKMESNSLFIENGQLRKSLKDVLRMLEAAHRQSGIHGTDNKRIVAARSVLNAPPSLYAAPPQAAPAQEPVAFVKWIQEGGRTHRWLAWADADQPGAFPLYAAPQPAPAHDPAVAPSGNPPGPPRNPA